MDNKKASDHQQYWHNPLVTLREEDEEGGLLYDTSKKISKIVNYTGLLIWKEFILPACSKDVVTSISNYFEDIPLSEIQKDVMDFIDQLLEIGFIETVKEKENL